MAGKGVPQSDSKAEEYFGTTSSVKFKLSKLFHCWKESLAIKAIYKVVIIREYTYIPLV